MTRNNSIARLAFILIFLQSLCTQAQPNADHYRNLKPSYTQVQKHLLPTGLEARYHPNLPFNPRRVPHMLQHKRDPSAKRAPTGSNFSIPVMATRLPGIARPAQSASPSPSGLLWVEICWVPASFMGANRCLVGALKSGLRADPQKESMAPARELNRLQGKIHAKEKDRTSQELSSCMCSANPKLMQGNTLMTHRQYRTMLLLRTTCFQ